MPFEDLLYMYNLKSSWSNVGMILPTTIVASEPHLHWYLVLKCSIDTRVNWILLSIVQFSACCYLPPHWLIAGQIFWSCWFFMGTLWQLGTFVPNLLSPCVWQNREIHQFQKSKWNAHSRTVWEVLKTLDISKKGTALIDISKWTYSVLSGSRPTFHQHNWKHSQSAKDCTGTLNAISEQILLIFYTLSTA